MEIVKQELKLKWVPDKMKDHFISYTMGTYEKATEFPALYDMVGMMSDFSTEVYSYHKTDGQDLKYFENMKKAVGPEDQDFEDEVLDSCFSDAADDVESIMRFYRMSYCCLNDPKYIRKIIVHPGVEVW